MKTEKHPIARVSIRPACRETRGVDGAFDEACKQLKKYYQLFAHADANRARTWRIELY